MMKRAFLLLIALAMVFGFSVQAHSTLWLRGVDDVDSYQLIYDDVLDITWYDYTNAPDYWQGQWDWADTLTLDFGGTTYGGWRLPETVDGPYVWGTDGTTTAGANITNSEMGYLFYTALGNLGYYATDGTFPQPGWGLNNTGFTDGDGNVGSFVSLLTSDYWSDTTTSDDIEEAWYFEFRYGEQLVENKVDYDLYGLAVMDGDIAAVAIPEPGTLLLLGSGLLGLGLVHRVRRKTKANA